ncbi:MAG: metallophosphoesterase [Cytophagales bacterium]|nr:metallophosphoesterase [Cytophagales bacterium]
MRVIRFFLLIIACSPFSEGIGQKAVEADEQYFLWPNYMLPGNAANLPGNPIPKPASKFQEFVFNRQMAAYRANPPDDILINFLESPLPSSFSLEFWLLHHVNQPLTLDFILQTVKNPQPDHILRYHAESEDGKKDLTYVGKGKNENFELRQKLFQQYWSHIAVVFDLSGLTFYQNGAPIGTVPQNMSREGKFQLSLAGYFSHEPFFKIENLLKKVGIYHRILDRQEIYNLYEEMQDFVERGIKHNEIFHFTAGPYLHFTTGHSVNIIWETNIPSIGAVNYGKDAGLGKRIHADNVYLKTEGEEFTYIYEATLDSLEDHTSYFYNIDLKSYEGQHMESGILTFQTAVEGNKPFIFALIGDTETRPHINNRIAQMIWQERPDFVLHLGDLTDGGKQPSKWQWNYEYFEGIGALHRRIPVFPVAGNGEGDLYWYRRYHKLPGEEAYYKFNYGNGVFFMLNSNTKAKEFAPGGEQYKWLDRQLSESSAEWKFVALHHAPYSTDENDYGDAYKGPVAMGDKHVRQIVPLFEKHGVDVVFFGHLHSYSRMGPIAENSIDQKHGVWYIQAGGAGGNLEDFAPTKAWFSQKTFPNHHYCTINIMDDEFILKMYDLKGAMRDYFIIKKPAD